MLEVWDQDKGKNAYITSKGSSSMRIKMKSRKILGSSRSVSIVYLWERIRVRNIFLVRSRVWFRCGVRFIPQNRLK